MQHLSSRVQKDDVAVLLKKGISSAREELNFIAKLDYDKLYNITQLNFDDFTVAEFKDDLIHFYNPLNLNSKNNYFDINLFKAIEKNNK